MFHIYTHTHTHIHTYTHKYVYIHTYTRSVISCSVVSNSLRSMDCSPPGSSVHQDSPGKNTGVGCHALLQGIFPYLGVELRSSAFQADSLPSEPYVCPKEI